MVVHTGNLASRRWRQIKKIKCSSPGAGEIVQECRALASLPEDLSLASSNQVRQLTEGSYASGTCISRLVPHKQK